MQEQYGVGNLIYDAGIYDGMNTDLSDLEFYKKWLPTNKDAKILELCCGTGRLTIPIAQLGYNITGLDFTASMLEQARKKASRAKLSIDFVQGDMRSFELSERFDLIFIPFNSIHHLYTNNDLFNTLRSVKRHLKEDGLFLLDCFNPDIAFMTQSQHELKDISSYTTQDGRVVQIKEIMNYHSSTQINRIEWHYYINGEFDSIQKLDMRMFFPIELDTYLTSHGLEIAQKFGNFDQQEFTDHSQKQIYVCRLKSSQ